LAKTSIPAEYVEEEESEEEEEEEDEEEEEEEEDEEEDEEEEEEEEEAAAELGPEAEFPELFPELEFPELEFPEFPELEFPELEAEEAEAEEEDPFPAPVGKEAEVAIPQLLFLFLDIQMYPCCPHVVPQEFLTIQ